MYGHRFWWLRGTGANGLISTDFYAFIFPFSKYVVLVSIEKIHQTFERVLHYISKHLKVRQKYSTACHIFNSLLCVKKCDETLSLVFNILHRQL